jgi:hypothetical protein
MSYKEIISVSCENRTEHSNKLYGKNTELFKFQGLVVHIITAVL